ncbi:MAG: winged helix-turn-helix domain-containing protein [Candidatus Micrarchaeota archaeon]|nr:winged helix-turn-helix domain-containing protein [Candidatus Micrarchaeota archaeon]
MRICFAIALAALISLAGAAYVAHFAPSSGKLNSTSESEFLKGAIGDYGVLAYTEGGRLSVLVEGEEESQGALAHEIFRLQKAGVIESGCEPAALLGIRDGAEYYCNEKGAWVSCNYTNGCTPLLSESALPAAAPPAPPASGAFGTEDKAAKAGTEKAGAQSQQTLAQESKAQQEWQDGAQAQGGKADFWQPAALFAAVIAAIILSFLILQQRQAQEEIAPQEIGLLSNETRAGILSELEGADRIPTDLSNKLGKSKATIVEHLETLRQAGFVEKLETPGRKFVYYRLTQKGKKALLRRDS